MFQRTVLFESWCVEELDRINQGLPSLRLLHGGHDGGAVNAHEMVLGKPEGLDEETQVTMAAYQGKIAPGRGFETLSMYSPPRATSKPAISTPVLIPPAPLKRSTIWGRSLAISNTSCSEVLKAAQRCKSKTKREASDSKRGVGSPGP